MMATLYHVCLDAFCKRYINSKRAQVLRTIMMCGFCIHRTSHILFERREF
jgi:hypothetical protein